MKLLQHIGIGLSIGFVFTTFFSIFFIGFNTITIQFLAWLIASALYGASALLFQIKSINLLLCSILHYAICLAITAVNIYLFYTDYFVSALLSFTLSYIMLYIIMWLIERRKISALNEKLNKKM